MRLCYISRNYYGLSGAGNKAKTDIERTLRGLGARNLGLRTTFYDNKVVAFLLNLVGIVKMMFCIRKGDRLVLQYPVKKYFSFICRVAHWRKAQIIVIIHDLMSLHRKRVTLETELSRLSKGDVIIASNEKMQQWLAAQGLQRPMTALGLFDYLDNVPHESHKTHESHEPHAWSLVYAGALVMRKNSYLLELANKAEHFDLHIYGNADGLPGIDKAPHAVCYPFTPADEFIRNADGDFGLVWDGDSLETCQGDFGEYLRYNSPHKVSFYLRAGLPVIIWREAAVASIIEQEGIGITITSIAELEQRLQTLTTEELEAMRQNVARVSQRLVSGQYFQKALRSALSIT
ncbi:MAG: galactofuranosyltransferase [Prevotella sp.]|nr:galactofuranosyltransferase [Prevotella sp.]